MKKARKTQNLDGGGWCDYFGIKVLLYSLSRWGTQTCTHTHKMVLMKLVCDNTHTSCPESHKAKQEILTKTIFYICNMNNSYQARRAEKRRGLLKLRPVVDTRPYRKSNMLITNGRTTLLLYSGLQVALNSLSPYPNYKVHYYLYHHRFCCLIKYRS